MQNTVLFESWAWFGKTAVDTYLGSKTNIPNAFHLFMSIYISSSVIYIHFYFFLHFRFLICCRYSAKIHSPFFILSSYKQGADYFNFLFYIIKRTIFKKCGGVYFSYAFFSAPRLLLNINTKSVPSNIFYKCFTFHYFFIQSNFPYKMFFFL